MGDEEAGTAPERTPLGNEPRFPGGVQEVAERTWAWLQPNGELGESNAGLAAGDGESLLVDTLWDERLTARMLEGFAAQRAAAPVTTLVNTHGDGDHWYGNRLAGAERIVATERAATQMEEEPPSMLTRMRPLPALAGRLGALPLLPGRERLRGLAAFGDALAAYEFAGLEPTAPNSTFEGEMRVEFGGRPAELIEVGPAHTAGDAIVWLSDVAVCFSGDIVFSEVTPIMWEGPAEGWVAALERIAALEPGVVVPGHGPPCGLERLEELADYWRWLPEAVPAEGPEVDAVERLIRDERYRDAAWGGWLAPERTLVNVAIIARHRAGAGGGLGVAERISLLAKMGALRERLSAAGVR